jgi:hypothetical protein
MATAFLCVVATGTGTVLADISQPPTARVQRTGGIADSAWVVLFKQGGRAPNLLSPITRVPFLDTRKILTCINRVCVPC